MWVENGEEPYTEEELSLCDPDKDYGAYVHAEKALSKLVYKVTLQYMTEDLYAAKADDKKSLITVDGYKHASYPYKDRHGYQRIVKDFLEKYYADKADWKRFKWEWSSKRRKKGLYDELQ